jgi:hypothetical protein
MAILQVYWQGIDGSIWDLYKGTQGLMLAPGLSGLHLPVWKQQVSTSARVPGRRYLGTTYEPRTVILNLHVGDMFGTPRTDTTWRQLDDLVWKAFSAETPGLLYVISDTGGYRKLSCRMEQAPDPVHVLDPGLQGLATYSVTLVADNPWWLGLDIATPSISYAAGNVVQYYGGGVARTVTDGVTTNASATLTSATAAFTSTDTGGGIFGAGIPAKTTMTYVNATTVTLSNAATATATGVRLRIINGGTGYGPPYVVTQSTVANQVVSNPGDRPAWPRWTVTGPGIWTIGTPGHTTVLPSLASGAQIIIDTDPMISTIVDGTGANLWPTIGPRDFSQPVAPGLNQPLVATVSGGGSGSSAVLTFTPTFARAW